MVAVKDGRVVATHGDMQAEVNRGLNCVKGYFLSKIMYGQDRLIQPLLRKKNGQYAKDGQFEPVSWDEAFGTMAAQWKRVLKEKGPTAVGMFGFNFPVTLAALAKINFNAGPSSFGLLTTALAVGALGGALAGSARRARPSAYIVVAAAIAVGLAQGARVTAHDDGTTAHLWLEHIKTMADPGTINDSTNPVDWTRLLGVPTDIADVQQKIPISDLHSYQRRRWTPHSVH